MAEVKFVLRLPTRTHKQLKKEAKDTHQSMNRIISESMRARYDHPLVSMDEKVAKYVASIEKKLAQILKNTSKAKKKRKPT